MKNTNIEEIKSILADKPKWLIDKTISNVEKYSKGELISKYSSDTIKPILEEDIIKVSELNEESIEKNTKIGLEQLKKSEFAYFVMAGGVSTSMGGCAKAIVEAKKGKSFLEIKLDHIRAIQKKYDCKIPVILMTSQETDDAIRKFIQEKKLDNNIEFIWVLQPVTIRFIEDENSIAPAKFKDGKISFVPGGHYDSFILLNEIKDQLKSKGIKTIFINNIDNLGATIDPLLLGCHINSESYFTPEIAQKAKGDKGGTFARIHNVPKLLEGPMVPEDYTDIFQDVTTHKFFNTNQIYVNIDIFDFFEEINSKIPVFINKKEFEGIKMFGFEGAIGLVFGAKDSKLLVIDRQLRFIPTKYLHDLWLLRSNFTKYDEENCAVIPSKPLPPKMDIPNSFLGNIEDLNSKIADKGETTDFSELTSLIWKAKDGKVGSNVKFIGDVTINEGDEIIEDNKIIEG